MVDTKKQIESSEQGKKISGYVKKLLGEYGLLVAIIIFIIPVSIITPVFLSPNNLVNVLLQLTVLGALSVGQTFVILSGGGGIDLSVGSVLAFAAVIGAGLIMNQGVPVAIGIIITIAIGIGIGLINGLIVTKVKISPLICTLAIMTAVRGGVMIYTGGADIIGLPRSYTALVTEGIGPISYAIILVILMFVVADIILKKTRYGRQLYAVGGNEHAALVSGINVNRIRMIAYTISGLCSGIAGLILTARLYTAGPRAGNGMELSVVSAVVIGGTSLSGGVGNIFGTVLGVIILSIIDNVTNLLAVPPAYVQTFKGLIILLAAIIDRFRTADK